MTCRHATRTTMYRIQQPDGRWLIIPHGRCRRCGETVSLGPSNDTSDAVQREIVAAEIAANENELGRLIGRLMNYESKL